MPRSSDFTRKMLLKEMRHFCRKSSASFVFVYVCGYLKIREGAQRMHSDFDRIRPDFCLLFFAMIH